MTEPIGDPFIVLMERTLSNLDFIHENTRRFDESDLPGSDALFEVTQTINSFLGILVMPWDRVFNQTLLNGTSNKADVLRRLGFPIIQSSRPDTDEARPHLGSMLDSMRNGAAHGGISLLGLREFQTRRPNSPVPLVTDDHIAAIEIESKGNLGEGDRNWGCILSVDEMVQFLRALCKLTEQEAYVRPEVWAKHREGRRKRA